MSMRNWRTSNVEHSSFIISLRICREPTTMTPDHDTAFQMSASNIRFGQGVTREIGMDLLDLGVRRTLVVIDPALRSLPVGETVLASLKDNGVPHDVFDEVCVEPTDSSFQRAAEVAVAGQFDSFVAVGGCSSIDTANAANLSSTHPAHFLDYVTATIARGKPFPPPPTA